MVFVILTLTIMPKLLGDENRGFIATDSYLTQIFVILGWLYITERDQNYVITAVVVVKLFSCKELTTRKTRTHVSTVFRILDTV